MCTILIAWRCLDDAAAVIAGNRDELVARPSAGPALLHEQPAIFGGRDLTAGGTWLAVRPDGHVAAVTNRRRGEQDEVFRDPNRRSRGGVPVSILSSADPRASLGAIRPDDYNPFNVLLLTPRVALVGHGDGGERLDLVELAPGPHVLCVHDVDDPTHEKERLLRERLVASMRGVSSSGECVEVMTDMLKDHGHPSGDPRDATCIHGDVYGTVSASSVVIGDERTISYRFAGGRPCVTPFEPVELEAE